MESMVVLPDKNLRHVSHEINEETILIYVEAITQQSICPYCGKVSNTDSRYVRKLSDLPIQNKKVKLLINNKKYFCVNESCTQKTFAQRFSFFKPKSTKTRRLWEEIIKISSKQSSVSASKYLRDSVANVGKITICNLLKKDAKMIDKSKISMVCIDDFALKKRQRYGTVMVNIEHTKLWI